MATEAETAVQTGVIGLVTFALGLMAKWGYQALVKWWERTDTAAELDTKAKAAQRKEDRANYQGVIEELYRHSDRQEEDIKKLQADMEVLRKEHQLCEVRTAELRTEIVGLKRRERAIRKYLKDKEIVIPGLEDDDENRPPSGHALPAVNPGGEGKA